MKILIAPDSFKHSLSALQAASAIESGVKRVLKDAECICIPMADGGEGTVEAILNVAGGKRVRQPVSGPLGGRVQAEYAFIESESTAVIEMAQASGLMLIPLDKRNPMNTSTYGTGQLILDAINRGARKIIITLGGSATIDGGAGMAQALGVRFRDSHGKIIRKYCNGAMLGSICSIDMGRRRQEILNINFIAAADVNTGLCGKQGAAVVFGKQKGATESMINTLDANLKKFAIVIRKFLGTDLLNTDGAGAAGGLGGGLVAFTGAEIVSGIDLVMKYTGFESMLANADLVFTGEGRIDSQSHLGKVIWGISRAARQAGVPVIAIGGVVTDDARVKLIQDFEAIESAASMDIPLQQAITNATRNVSNAAQRAMSMVLAGQQLLP